VSAIATRIAPEAVLILLRRVCRSSLNTKNAATPTTVPSVTAPTVRTDSLVRTSLIVEGEITLWSAPLAQ
jgi:hypothetical protein